MKKEVYCLRCHNFTEVGRYVRKKEFVHHGREYRAGIIRCQNCKRKVFVVEELHCLDGILEGLIPCPNMIRGSSEEIKSALKNGAILFLDNFEVCEDEYLPEGQNDPNDPITDEEVEQFLNGGWDLPT